MNEKILIIDDEPAVLKTTQKILASEGYKVKNASSGKEAVAILKVENFDLAITDIRMPGMDGLEVIRQAKKLDHFLEIIVLTGYGTTENAVKALKEEGAFDFLIKPLKGIDDL
ncbi:MAG: response regulator, partial [Deltaproteobacteria bacterium]|nr:response regulator [Deltaproteobacteria bacterium]